MNSQSNKGRTFHVNMLVEAYASLSENTFYNSSSAAGLFLICLVNFPTYVRLAFLLNFPCKKQGCNTKRFSKNPEIRLSTTDYFSFKSSRLKLFRA